MTNYKNKILKYLLIFLWAMSQQIFIKYRFYIKKFLYQSKPLYLIKIKYEIRS